MDYFMITLRLIHIFAGISWVGSALLMFFQVFPSINATDEAGQKVVQHLMMKGRLSSRLTAAGGLTILAGFLLYWLDSDGFTSSWSSSGPGIGFGIGGVAGLIGFIYGLMVGRYSKALVLLSSEIKDQPTSDQSDKLAALKISSGRASMLSTLFLIVAATFMAIARYLNF